MASIMEWQDYPWRYGFVLSSAINVSIACYFLFYAVMDFITSKCFDREHRLRKAHKKTPNFMHCFYFELVLYTFVVIDATILLITSFPMTSPFVGGLPHDVIILLTVVCGLRIFLFCRDLMLFKNTRYKIVTLLYHIVFILVVGNAMITEMSGIMAMIVILGEGDIVFANTGKLLRHLGYKHSTGYRCTMYLGCYASLIFRAILPLALLAVSLVNGKPFQMSHHAIVVFFLALVFYGVVNTWHVNSTIAKVCKRKARIIEVPYANFVQEVDDSLKQSEDEIPPSYQDACQTDLPVISGSPAVMATGSHENGVGNGATSSNIRIESDSRHVDMAGIILNGNGDSYQHSAISHA